MHRYPVTERDRCGWLDYRVGTIALGK